MLVIQKPIKIQALNTSPEGYIGNNTGVFKPSQNPAIIPPIENWALSFAGDNDYSKLNYSVYLVDSFSIEFITDSSFLSYPLCGSVSTYFTAATDNEVYYRCGGPLITFNHSIPSGTKVKLTRNIISEEIELYINDIFIEAQSISGVNLTANFPAQQLMRVGTAYGQGQLWFLKFYDATQTCTFNFPEGTGTTSQCDEFAVNGISMFLYGASWVSI